MDAPSPTHSAASLYRASIERIVAAQHALAADRLVECIYLGGLAVECVLQAIVKLDTPLHDARHDLNAWLRKARRSLQDAMYSKNTLGAWNHVVAVWRNEFRYYSASSLHGAKRTMRRTRGLKGDATSVLRAVASAFLDSARTVHKQGVSARASYTIR